MRNNTAAYVTIVIITAILSCATFLAYWHTDRTKKTSFTIVCTTTILADTVSSIVGDHALVISLMAPGVDPHTYRAREGDFHTLLSADLIVYNGLHLEGKIADILQNMTMVPTIAATDGISRSYLLESEEFPGIYDPHVWFDTTLWIEVVRYLATKLTQYDTENTAIYEHNARNYIQQLHHLDAWIKEQIETIDPDKRILITAHDAFGYFGRHYGMRVVGLQGISTDSEPGISDIQELRTLILHHRIPSLFVESSVSSRALQAVQHAVKAQGFQVLLGEELYSDTLGMPHSNEQTYCGMVRHNVQAIVNGLH